MDEVEGFRERVLAARSDLSQMPRTAWRRLGPPDPETSERWDGDNVLGHLAEMLPYWTDQVRDVLDGRTDTLGRDEAGYEKRREAVDGAKMVGEDELLARIAAGLDDLVILLERMRDADLERQLTQYSHRGSREVDLRHVMDNILVGHVEAHLRQLRELG
jgi:hypothetical protein